MMSVFIESVFLRVHVLNFTMILSVSNPQMNLFFFHMIVHKHFFCTWGCVFLHDIFFQKFLKNLYMIKPEYPRTRIEKPWGGPHGFRKPQTRRGNFFWKNDKDKWIPAREHQKDENVTRESFTRKPYKVTRKPARQFYATASSAWGERSRCEEHQSLLKSVISPLA